MDDDSVRLAAVEHASREQASTAESSNTFGLSPKSYAFHTQKTWDLPEDWQQEVMEMRAEQGKELPPSQPSPDPKHSVLTDPYTVEADQDAKEGVRAAAKVKEAKHGSQAELEKGTAVQFAGKEGHEFAQGGQAVGVEARVIKKGEQAFVGKESTRVVKKGGQLVDKEGLEKENAKGAKGSQLFDKEDLEKKNALNVKQGGQLVDKEYLGNEDAEQGQLVGKEDVEKDEKGDTKGVEQGSQQEDADKGVDENSQLVGKEDVDKEDAIGLGPACRQGGREGCRA